MDARTCHVLARIACILLKLSVLAERASRRSLPRRWLMLFYLRAAEAVAAGFATDISPFDLSDDSVFGDSPLDALRLAYRFRVLAGVFLFLAEGALESALWAGDHLPQLNIATACSAAAGVIVYAGIMPRSRAPPRLRFAVPHPYD